MRELFKAMIEADRELPRSMVIAQLKWQRLAEPAEHTEVRQNGEWYETALVRGHEALTVLLKVLTPDSIPVKPKPAKTDYHIPTDVVPWRAFNRSEILEFVTDVEDHNSIHQQENAVVPGCQILEAMAAYLAENVESTITAVKIRFRRPTFVDETIVLQRSGRTIQGFTAHRPVFTCSYK